MSLPLLANIITSVLLCNLQLPSWVMSSTDNGTHVKPQDPHTPNGMNYKRGHLFRAKQREPFFPFSDIYD